MIYTCSYRYQANLYSKLTTFTSNKSKKLLYKVNDIYPQDKEMLNNLPQL